MHDPIKVCQQLMSIPTLLAHGPIFGLFGASKHVSVRNTTHSWALSDLKTQAMPSGQRAE
eukprot:189300-Pelagomonas_calceolata.AAC.4